MLEHASVNAKRMLELANLHGDIVGEAPLEAATTQPSVTWETDEFGVPRATAAPAKITKIATSSSAPATAATSLTLNRPSGTQSGDLMLATVAAASGTVTPPADWTAARPTVTSGASDYVVMYRVAGASEPASYTWSMGASGKQRGGILTLRNVDTANPINTTATATGISANVTLPDITPSAQNTAISASSARTPATATRPAPGPSAAL